MRGEGMRGPKRILVVASPVRSRGCAQIPDGGVRSRREGEKVVIAIASPVRFRLLRLANLTRHEFTHSKGLEHEQMPRDIEWAMGPLPGWAKRFDRPGWPRHLGRAPDQMSRARPA